MSCGSWHADPTMRRMEAERWKADHSRQVWAAAWTGAVQGAVSGARGAPAVPGKVRVGDAERESAVTALGDHYAAGRLSQEEFDERAGVAWSARTAGDLAPLFSDLPSLEAQRRPRRVPQARDSWRWGMGLWWIIVLLLVLATADELPWFAVAIFAGLWWSGMLGGLLRWAHRSR